MTKILRSITNTRNWIGKTVLWAIGLVAVLSQFWPYILTGFMLTDKEVPEAGVTFVTVTVFGLAFILGGTYLNRIVDKFVGPGKNGKDAA